MLASGLASSVVWGVAAEERAELHKADVEVGELLDKAGYKSFLGDTNGPDQYDQPLAEAKDERDSHQTLMLLSMVGGLATYSVGIAGAWVNIVNTRRQEP
jgi:hypothetical protein